jgi:hypothetical protein
MSNDRADRPKMVGPLIVIFGSTAILLLAAWGLWITHDEKAQGAAITLAGVAASHLIKEVQQLLKSWLGDDAPPTRPRNRE